MAIPDNTNLLVHDVETNLTNPNSNFVCLPRPAYTTTIYPHLENCAGVLRALPSDGEEAIFHSGGADDGYKLPLFERYKDCEVLVETIRPNVAPVSSWVEIGLAATELNMACFTSLGTAPGATTFCGGRDMVKITLRGTRGRPVGNVTDESTGTG